MAGITKPGIDERYKEVNLRKAIEIWRFRRYEKMMKRIVKNGSHRTVSVTALGMRQVPKVRIPSTCSTNCKPNLENLIAGNPHADLLMESNRQQIGEHTTSGKTRKYQNCDFVVNGNRVEGHENLGDDCKQETLQGPFFSTPCDGKSLDLPSFSISAIKEIKSIIPGIQSKKCLKFENA